MTARPSATAHAPALSRPQRWLALWAGLGAAVQLCLPTTWTAVTTAGPAALWLWLLPLASLAMLLLVGSGQAPAARARTAMPVRRRRRRGGDRHSSPVQRVGAPSVAVAASGRATRPPKGLSVTWYEAPSRIGR